MQTDDSSSGGLNIFGDVEPTLFGKEEIDFILRYAASHGSSDIHFVPGYPVKMEIMGSLVDGTMRSLGYEDTAAVVTASKGVDGMPQILGGKALSYAYEIPAIPDTPLIKGSYRFRTESAGCEYMANSASRTVFRYLPSDVPRLETQTPAISEELIKFFTPTRGLVLVVGSTGTGKSTLMAGFVRYIGERRSINVMTFEEPIEFVYRPERLRKEGDWKAMVIQSEIGKHYPTWNDAMKSALRSAPKVALVGEMRDADSIKIAIEFVRTGHCLYSTMHVDGVAAVPAEVARRSGDDADAWSRVVSVLRGVFYQRLAKRIDGGRMAVREYLVVDADIRNRLMHCSSAKEAEKLILDTIRERGTDIASEARRLLHAGFITEEEAERIIREAY